MKMSDEKEQEKNKGDHMENDPSVEEKSELETQWCPEDRVIYDE